MSQPAVKMSSLFKLEYPQSVGVFNTYDEARASRGGATELAFVAFNVMKDGTVTLVSPEVDGFIRDANGTWIAE